MADHQGTSGTAPTVNDQTPDGARADSYNLLMRQSKKLGETATRTLIGAKQMLQQGVPGTDWRIPGFSRGKKEEAQSDVDNLKRIVQQSHEVLAEVQTVFPVTLFPDRVCLDRSVITITKRTFFWSSSTISIRIEDILNVATTLGPMFGSITIASRVMSTVDHYTVNFLWRKDAVELKRMIQGYMIAKHSMIETQHLSTEELVEHLRELGNDNGARLH